LLPLLALAPAAAPTLPPRATGELSLLPGADGPGFAAAAGGAGVGVGPLDLAAPAASAATAAVDGPCPSSPSSSDSKSSSTKLLLLPPLPLCVTGLAPGPAPAAWLAPAGPAAPPRCSLALTCALTSSSVNDVPLKMATQSKSSLLCSSCPAKCVSCPCLALGSVNRTLFGSEL